MFLSKLNALQPSSVIVSDAGGIYSGTFFGATATVNGAASLEGRRADGVCIMSARHRPEAVRPSLRSTWVRTPPWPRSPVATHYAPAQSQVTFVIDKAPLTVTTNNQTKTYGTANPTLTGTLIGVVGHDTITVSYSTTATQFSNARSSYPISATLSDPNNRLSNYTVTNPGGSLTINKANQSITWTNPAAITYGAALGGTQLNAVAAGIAGGSQPGALSYTPSAGTMLKAGTHQALRVDAAATTNYNAATKTVYIDVNKANPTIAWPVPAAITYGDALDDTQLDATAGVPGTLVYTPAAGTLLDAGDQTLSVTFTPDDTANYTPAMTSVHLTVNTAGLAVSATGIDRMYDGTTKASVTLTDNRVAGDTLTIGYAASFDNKNVGTDKPVAVSGIAIIGGDDAANYTLANTTATATATITRRTLSVLAMPNRKIYDGTTVAAALPAMSGLAPGDTASFTVVYDTKDVGDAKTLTPIGSVDDGNDGKNYTINAISATSGVIMARALTVSATGVDKVYDGTPAASVTLTDDRLAGDSLTIGYATAHFGSKTVGSARVVSVEGLSISGQDAGNYTLTSATALATATITPRPLTVTATGADKVYDGSTAATVSLFDDRVPGDVLAAGYGTANFSDKNAGIGKTVNVGGISILGDDAGNYTLQNTAATTTANITPRALAVSATAADKIYDATRSATVTLSDDRLSGDALSLAYTSAEFTDSANVGVAKPVMVSGITISSGSEAGDYVLTSSTAAATASISPNPQMGPEIFELRAVPNPAVSAPALSAVATTTNTDNSKIVGVEYFIDTVKTSGKGTKLAATDKKFDNVIENVAASLKSAFGKLKQGPHAIYVHAKDALGRWGAMSTVTLVKDTLGPITSAAAVSPARTNFAPILTAKIDDTLTGGTNVVAAEFFIDKSGKNGQGTPITAAFTSATQTVTVTLPPATFDALKQGKHTIYIHGKDAVGNWGKLVSATFVKDTLGPVTSGVKVTASPTGAAPILTAKVDDKSKGGSILAAAEYTIDANGPGGSGIPIALAANKVTQTITVVLDSVTFQNLAVGQHTVYVRAKDATGNWGDWQSATFVKATSAAAAPASSGVRTLNASSRSISSTQLNDAAMMGILTDFPSTKQLGSQL